MGITINPLHPLFGAELIGADVRDASPELVETVNAAMSEYAVVVIRDQAITDEEQIAFSRRFGPLELPLHMGLKWSKRRRIHPAMYEVSNLDATGDFLPPEDLRHLGNGANEEFHTDSSFNTLPTKRSLLSARIIPPEGADTHFADTRAAWDELPAAMKEKARDAVAEHFFWKTRMRAGWTDIIEEMRRAMPPARHPVVRTIPESGRTALYLGNHATHIVGWPAPEGERFISEINEFAAEPRFVYRHRWRPADFVLWDNRCVLHRATSYDVFRYKRDLRRTTMNEYGPETSSTDALGIPPPA
jgi:alpha-ketoglutarate-dependent 2,4-dichlorophenoxyacetate dioxygenase